VTTVIGIDLSLRGSGVVVWRSGDPQPPRVFTIDGGPLGEQDPYGWEAAERHARILARIWPYCTGEVLAVLEDRVGVAGTGSTNLDLAGLHSVIDYGLTRRRIPIARINLSRLKLFATGSGKADKAAMLLAAERRLAPIGIEVTNDNEADAAWLLAIALQHLGRPLCDLPAKQADVAERVAWPPFKLPKEASK
jgi:Holliday junction resolvasome RuvABC endonuclease subunit